METPKEARVREKREMIEMVQEKVNAKMSDWNPFSDEKCTSDPYKTLIISNISYNVNETKLKENFKIYGPVKSVRIIRGFN